MSNRGILRGSEPVFVGFDLSRAEILKAVAQNRKERKWLKKK
jgi:hypothetical protein